MINIIQDLDYTFRRIKLGTLKSTELDTLEETVLKMTNELNYERDNRLYTSNLFVARDGNGMLYAYQLPPVKKESYSTWAVSKYGLIQLPEDILPEVEWSDGMAKVFTREALVAEILHNTDPTEHFEELRWIRGRKY